MSNTKIKTNDGWKNAKRIYVNIGNGEWRPVISDHVNVPPDLDGSGNNSGWAEIPRIPPQPVELSDYNLGAANWDLNGDASSILSGAGVRLTPGSASRVGSAYFTQRIDVTENWEVNFTLRASGGNYNGKGDGLALVINPSTDTSYYSAVGGTLGYSSVPGYEAPATSPGFFVYEFDSHDSGAEPTANHAAFHYNPSGGTTSSNSDMLQYYNSFPSNWYGTGDHTASLKYSSGSRTVSAYYDGQVIMSRSFDMSQIVHASDNGVHFGFTAATGGYYAEHRVSNITVSGVPV